MTIRDIHEGITLKTVTDTMSAMKFDDSSQPKSSVSDDRNIIDQLPTEILSLILQRTQPPSVFLDRSNPGAWHSPLWKSQGLKISLVLVCRRWYSVAVELLYQDVTIYRPRQIVALSNALSSNPDLASLIKTLSIYAVAWAVYKSKLSLITIIKDIIHACRKISRLDVHDLLECPDADELWPVIDSSPILALNIHQDCSRPRFTGFQTCMSLVTLSLDLSRQRSDFCESIALPYLQDLRLRFTMAIDSIPESLDALTESWTMPELRSISIFTRDCECVPSLARFLLKHGGQIRYLSLFLNWISQSHQAHAIPTADHFHMLLNPCPAVQHLVLGPFDTTLAPALRHREVVWLDVSLERRLFNTEARRTSVERDFRAADLPKLRGLRLMDRALSFSLAEDLPRKLPPHESPGDEEWWTWQYPGMHIEYRKGVLERMDEWYLDAFIEASLDVFYDDASGATPESSSRELAHGPGDEDYQDDGEDEDEEDAGPDLHTDGQSTGSDLDTDTDSTYSQDTNASLSFSEVSFSADSSESESESGENGEEHE